MALRPPFGKAAERCQHSACHRDSIGLNATSATIPAHDHYPLNLGYTAETIASLTGYAYLVEAIYAL